jgi:hypothetical protein
MEVPAFRDETDGVRVGVEDGGEAGIVRRRAPGPLGHAEGSELRMGEFRLFAEEGVVGRVRAGITAFDIVEAEFVEQARNEALVLHAEIDARRLRAVAQRGVEEVETGFLLGLAHGFVPDCRRALTRPHMATSATGRTVLSTMSCRRACTAAAELCQPLIIRP